MLVSLLALILFPRGIGAELRYEFERLYHRLPVPAAAPAPVRVATPVMPHYILPVDHGGLVSGWYFMDPRFGDGPVQHTGVDLACAMGEPIRAAAGGIVQFATRNGDCGLEVAVQHADGVISYYCHLSGFVTRGRVNQGEIIGYCGSTGLSTGPHLHYEVRRWGVPVDPLTLP